jgi:hypothetical protein
MICGLTDNDTGMKGQRHNIAGSVGKCDTINHVVIFVFIAMAHVNIKSTQQGGYDTITPECFERNTQFQTMGHRHSSGRKSD